MAGENLSLNALIEKNKATQSTPWITLLEIQIKDTDIVIRLVKDVKTQEWGGQEWIAFPFEFGEIKEDIKEYPEVEVTINNSTRELQPYIEDYSGCVNSKVIMRIVYAGNLNINNYKAEIEESFSITGTTTDANNVTFKLGASQPNSIRFPLNRFLKNHCRFVFKSAKCGYVGSAVSCDKTRATCETLNNLTRFGGFPTIPLGGIYK